ncbi:MAG: molybdate ABC transporter substrate-binding protein [Acidimicrobiales bacterium]
MRSARLAAFLAAAALVSACGARSGGASSDGVTVLAAASLTEAFSALGGAAFSFAGSQQLVAQVEAGAPADVVATADADAMARLVRAGLVHEPRDFARNRLTIAVEPGNPEGIRGLGDLGRKGLKVVLADPAVPAGRYAREVLDRAGVRVRPVSLEPDVKAVAGKVLAGEADGGIVYVSDVPPDAAVPIPDDVNVVATYPVAVVRATRDRARAEAFVDRLLGSEGRDALAAHGFLLP